MGGFYRENKRVFFGALIFSFFCFGFMLTHYMLSIDEETWILKDTDSLQWLLQDRYGMYVYNLLFTKHGRFVPFFSDVAGIVFWNISGLLFAYVFFDFEKKGHWWIRLMMLCYYNSVPLCVGEAFAFTMQIVPEAFAMVLTAAAFLFTVKSWPGHRHGDKVLIVGLLLVSFGIYQALICVYITAVAAWCFLRFLGEDTVWQGFAAGVCYSMGSIIIYYILNFIIGEVIGTASYLSGNYIGWTSGSGILHTIFMAFANVVRVSLGITIEDVSIYGAVPLRILMLLFMAVCIRLFFEKKGWMGKAGMVIFSLGVVLSPFSLYIAMGTYKTHGRMLIALSLSGMIEILVIYESLSRKWVERAAGVIFAGILTANASNMNQIYYHSYLVYQHDKTVANQIMYDIQRKGYDYHSKAVVFVGDKEMDNIPILKSGTLGASFFAWDGGNISRIVDFMEAEGYELHMPTPEQIEDGLARSKDMAAWPRKGSIVETEDSIIVYFSEPGEKWYQTNLGR